VLAAAFILIGVYQLYLNQMLQIRWRGWITDRALRRWMDHDAYYRLELGASETDNPDQRIADDARLFVARSVALSLGGLSALVTLGSFAIILWRISGVVHLSLGAARIALPGCMLWLALVYALVGTWLTARIGWRLTSLNYDQQRFEADFRVALVRLRENAEGVGTAALNRRTAAYRVRAGARAATGLALPGRGDLGPRRDRGVRAVSAAASKAAGRGRAQRRASVDSAAVPRASLDSHRGARRPSPSRSGRRRDERVPVGGRGWSTVGGASPRLTSLIRRPETLTSGPPDDRLADVVRGRVPHVVGPLREQVMWQRRVCARLDRRQRPVQRLIYCVARPR
jgi:ABC transporter transmembrane region 2